MTPSDPVVELVPKASLETMVKQALEAKERLRRSAYDRGFRPIVLWPARILCDPAAAVLQSDITALEAAATAPPPSVPLLSDSAQLLKDTIAHLTFTCAALGAGGLAAPQIGIPLRVFVVRTADESTIAIINPRVLEATGSATTVEHCLSLPGESFTKQRAAFVRLAGWGPDGREFEVGGDGLLAVALQHEFDHLEGRLLSDDLTNLGRDRLRHRLERRH